MGKIVLVDTSTDVLLAGEDATDIEEQFVSSEPATSDRPNTDAAFAKYGKIWLISAAAFTIAALALAIVTFLVSGTKVEVEVFTRYETKPEIADSHTTHTPHATTSNAHTNQLLRNEIYGHCICFHDTDPEQSHPKLNASWSSGPPVNDGSGVVVTTGICDEDRWVVRFNLDPATLEVRPADNKRCLVPLSPEREGSHLTLAPCPQEPRPESSWKMIPMQGQNDTSQGMQVRNGLGLCLDLEHQHVFGYVIQWKCKNTDNYKSANQLFKWVIDQ